jgi:hypothetical protein
MTFEFTQYEIELIIRSLFDNADGKRVLSEAPYSMSDDFRRSLNEQSHEFRQLAIKIKQQCP